MIKDLNTQTNLIQIMKKLNGILEDCNNLDLTKPLTIVGETHLYREHEREEIKIINRYKPKYLLVEALREIGSSPERAIPITKFYSIREIGELFPKLSDQLKKAYLEMEDIEEKLEAYKVRDFNDFMRVPAFELPYEYYEKFQEIVDNSAPQILMNRLIRVDFLMRSTKVEKTQWLVD